MSIKHALLGILVRQPCHGYELKQTFEEKVGEFWTLNYGQVYTTLERLYKDGLVEWEDIEQTDKPDKKMYRITEAGRVVFDEWRRQPVKAEPRALRDELFLKLLFMDRDQSEAVLRMIQTQQSVYMAHMMQLTNRKMALEDAAQQEIDAAHSDAEAERIEEETVIGTLLIDVAIYHAEADIRWLNHCEAKIKDLFAEG